MTVVPLSSLKEQVILREVDLAIAISVPGALSRWSAGSVGYL